MINICGGDMLEGDAEAVVCTVNTKGVMGKGVALACARRFEGLEDRYAAACAGGEVRVGEMWTFPTGLLLGPRLIVCFPTKEHWARPSRLEWVASGLAALVKTIEHHGLESVAVPALGCGLGGLAWPHVERLIQDALGSVEARIDVYPPR